MTDKNWKEKFGFSSSRGQSYVESDRSILGERVSSQKCVLLGDHIHVHSSDIVLLYMIYDISFIKNETILNAL